MRVGYRHCTLAQLDHFGFKSSSRQDARCSELSIEIYFYGVFSAVVRLPFWAILTLVFMFISASGLLARRSDEKVVAISGEVSGGLGERGWFAR